MAAKSQLGICLVLASSFHATQVQACPVVSESQAIETGEAEYAEARRLVAEAFTRSDLVFVGRVVEIEKEPLIRKESDGAEIHFVRTTARFEPLTRIKGDYSSDDVLYTDRIEHRIVDGEITGRITVGCSSLAWFYDVGELIRSYRYLVYADGAEIIRVNLIVDWFENLSVDNELQMLRGTEEP